MGRLCGRQSELVPQQIGIHRVRPTGHQSGQGRGDPAEIHVVYGPPLHRQGATAPSRDSRRAGVECRHIPEPGSRILRVGIGPSGGSRGQINDLPSIRQRKGDASPAVFKAGIDHFHRRISGQGVLRGAVVVRHRGGDG